MWVSTASCLSQPALSNKQASHSRPACLLEPPHHMLSAAEMLHGKRVERCHSFYACKTGAVCSRFCPDVCACTVQPRGINVQPTLIAIVPADLQVAPQGVEIAPFGIAASNGK